MAFDESSEAVDISAGALDTTQFVQEPLNRWGRGRGRGGDAAELQTKTRRSEKGGDSRGEDCANVTS